MDGPPCTNSLTVLFWRAFASCFSRSPFRLCAGSPKIYVADLIFINAAFLFFFVVDVSFFAVLGVFLCGDGVGDRGGRGTLAQDRGVPLIMIHVQQ